MVIRTVLSLCSGIGGLELGVKLAVPSTKCVCYVEGEAYAVAVLIKRMEEKILDEGPIWSDIRTFDGKPWGGKVDCVTAGYSCTPFSRAGSKKGIEDQKHLWPHVRRIVEEVRPKRCFFENVSNHLRVGFSEVHDDLRKLGYRVMAGVFAAEEIGTPHQRWRLFIMAHSVNAETSDSLRWSNGGEIPGLPENSEQYPSFPPAVNEIDKWAKIPGDLLPAIGRRVESKVCRVVNGVANRVDRIRTCGNAVVPLVAAYAWRTLEKALVGDE